MKIDIDPMTGTSISEEDMQYFSRKMVEDRLRGNLAKLRERVKDIPAVDIKEWQRQQVSKYRERKLEEGEQRKAEFMARMSKLDRKFANGPVTHGIGRPRMYQVYETALDKIDTEEKAYWLGFIFADGAISVRSSGYYLSIGLNSGDTEHLRKFCQFISPGRSPSCGYRGEAIISISSQYLVWSLSRWGLCPNKTYTNLDLPMIPYDLMPHFLRGLVDGDGWIYLYTTDGRWDIGIASFSRNILDQTDSYLVTELGVTPLTIDMRNGSWRMHKGVNLQVSQIVHYLYKDATIYLDRKMEIARRVMQEFPI